MWGKSNFNQCLKVRFKECQRCFKFSKLIPNLKLVSLYYRHNNSCYCFSILISKLNRAELWCIDNVWISFGFFLDYISLYLILICVVPSERFHQLEIRNVTYGKKVRHAPCRTQEMKKTYVNLRIKLHWVRILCLQNKSLHCVNHSNVWEVYSNLDLFENMCAIYAVWHLFTETTRGR